MKIKKIVGIIMAIIFFVFIFKLIAIHKGTSFLSVCAMAGVVIAGMAFMVTTIRLLIPSDWEED